MYDVTINYNGDDQTATIRLKGNANIFDHMERLVSEYPDKCSRFENSYIVPKSWVRVLPFKK